MRRYLDNSAISASPREEFHPQFDDEGNQTLIQTATVIWQVTYNGENRPVLWECLSTNSPTHNSSTPTLISMSCDCMGRRVTKNDQRFVYDNYLQIANFVQPAANIKFTTQNLQRFVWDPTELVATRQLVWQYENLALSYYTHDGNKNVSEVVSLDNNIQAHYEYAPFGALLRCFGSYAFFIGNCLTKKYEVLTAYKCGKIYSRIRPDKFSFCWIFLYDEVHRCK